MRNISRVRPLALVSAAAAVAVAALATPTLAAPVPEASSKLLFASFGDMPYLVPAVNYRQNGQEAEDRLVLQRLIEPTLRRRRDIPLLIHMGDIGRGRRRLQTSLAGGNPDGVESDWQTPCRPPRG